MMGGAHTLEVPVNKYPSQVTTTFMVHFSVDGCCGLVRSAAKCLSDYRLMLDPATIKM